ncbi:metallopeptidase family M12-like protein [Tahibacter aquaticus]|uniref:Metallopeptidase family M12-like protein n=1 Tax=Tahibacter aquaticus TaxID=520092 RepID=A0A4R6Z4I4_9GAMM|nr:M12 family metallo-peptidase [Tahibacter aquaticus]TDR46572.1 metallopeptidase family M12-like protein [Tahibacter aquaticus]
MKQRILARACVLAIAAVAAPAFAADNTLFQPAALTPLKTDAAFAALANEASTFSVDVVAANAAAVDTSTETLKLDLDIGGPIRLTAERLSSQRNEDGIVTWHGTIAETRYNGARQASDIADDPMNSVTLVRNGDKLTGNIRVKGQLYALRPLFDGRHVIVEVDEAKMPADHDEAAYASMFEQERNRPVSPAAPKAVEANTTVRVLVNYTTAARNATADIVGLINLAVTESNQGYVNSGVELTLQLAGTGVVTYTETGNFSTELSRYRSTSDGYMDAIHAQRNSTTADVAVLIVNGSAYCGIGYMNVTASSAFTVVARTCATGYYSFAHEIGHNFGANHDPANASGSPYAYGHGYQRPANGWRTIMAYACSGASCTRINFWSNPNKTYGGVAMGTAATNNNARVLTERKATVAAFR